MAELVLVTGASGFLASHIVELLLLRGYRVRGTVRSLKNEAKVAPLRKLGGDNSDNLELVEADLLNSECWGKVVEGCNYVLHVASPHAVENPTDENELITPAVDGTLNVLRACRGNVKRVVLTSSIVSIYSSFHAPPNGKSYTEADFADPEKARTVYMKSKTLAERAAWDYVKEQSHENQLELVVINPAFIFGPLLTDSLPHSVEVIKALLNRELAMLPHIHFGLIDVRDVANAHVAAMTIPEAAGKRFIVSGDSLWLNEIAEIVAQEFKPMGYNVPTSTAPYPLLWLVGRFNRRVLTTLGEIGLEKNFDNSRMMDVLKISPKENKDTIIEACYSLIERGFVKQTSEYKAKTEQEN